MKSYITGTWEATMPLKLVPPRQGRKVGNSPNWRVRGTYLRVYIDQTAGTPKRGTAVKVLARIRQDIEQGRLHGRCEQTFAGAAYSYIKAGGERTYLRVLLEYFGNPPLSRIGQGEIDAAAEALYPHGSSATRNRHVYTPMSAVMRHAGVRLELRRPKGSSGNKQTTWLWPEQVYRLIEEAGKLSKEFRVLLIVLFYTGMRLNEALRLMWNDVRLDESFVYLADTKSGEPRAVFLPEVAISAIASLPRRSRVFRFVKGGHLYSMLRAAAFKAEIDLPERSAFHIARHTWATWMRRYGGLDTKGLVATGAWKDRKSADRYEHVEVSEEARKAALLPTPPGGFGVDSEETVGAA
jgi:integrase